MRDTDSRMNASDRYRPPIRRRRIQFNQALKLTRRAGCLLGGCTSGHNQGVPCPCISPAVQLSAGVRRRNQLDSGSQR